jgi:Flp pilus assembly protein TadD
VPDDTTGLARLVTTIDGGLLSAGDYEVVAALKGPGGVALTTLPRSLTLSPRAGAAAATGLSRAAWLSALTPAFARTRVLEADVLRPVLARLEARATAPAVRRALSHALDGRAEALVVDPAVGREDPVAGAFLTGVSLFARGDLEAAALQFREALRTDAEFAPAMFYLGACYAAGGRDREAAGAWQTAMIDEEAGVLPALLADAWLRAGDADAALDIVDEALAQAPADRALVERRITALLALDRTAEAMTAVDAAPLISPELLFAAMRVLVEAHTARRPIVSPEADRRRLQTYADRYTAASGPQQALVASWLTAWP